MRRALRETTLGNVSRYFLLNPAAANLLQILRARTLLLPCVARTAAPRRYRPQLLGSHDHRGVVTLKKGLVTLEAPVSLFVHPICSLDDDETMILRTRLYTLA